MCDTTMNPSSEPTQKSNIKLHVFSTTISEQRYIYEILKMKDSVLIFVNLQSRRELNDLSMAMKNRFGPIPLGTKIMGDFMEENSLEIARRVAKKLDKTVFVSVNVAADKYTLPMIEKQLFYEIKNKPDMF